MSANLAMPMPSKAQAPITASVTTMSGTISICNVKSIDTQCQNNKNIPNLPTTCCRILHCIGLLTILSIISIAPNYNAKLTLAKDEISGKF